MGSKIDRRSNIYTRQPRSPPCCKDATQKAILLTCIQLSIEPSKRHRQRQAGNVGVAISELFDLPGGKKTK